MLELRRLRLLRELHERGTIAAVAEALQFTPSAVSQQLAALEREAGVKLLERSGRGVRLTDPGLVLVDHATALLERAATAEADLAAAAGSVAGRGRVAAFQSVSFHLVVPAMRRLAREAPLLRCELVEAEPEDALPALALGDIDLIVGDEWQHQPRPLPDELERHDLLHDVVHLVLRSDHRVARRHDGSLPLRALAGETWIAGHPGMGWSLMTERACRELGGFEPEIRHRTNDANLALELVRAGLGLALLPDLPLPETHPELTFRPLAESRVERAIFAVTRRSDAARPSTRALLAELEEEAARVVARRARA